MISVYVEGYSRMLYRFFILHDTLALETALGIFAVFVRMLSLYKWTGKKKGERCLSLSLQNVQVPKTKEQFSRWASAVNQPLIFSQGGYKQ